MSATLDPEVLSRCRCLPPFRGPLCELEDPPRVQQKLRAVIHYITAETERDLQDLERSLTSLWIHFNKGYDYPVVIFHEGLSNKGRERIVAASENRAWLALVPRFKEVPPEWAEVSRQRASEFAVGYRAMTRWRSGPVFLEPALAGFDYAMTLDTDSYFPGPLGEDPFEVLHAQGLAAMFPHLGRESASVVVNFMHYFLLYCRLQKLDPRRTRMLAALIEKNYKWYQQCLMLDIEILRLDWFRGPVYQDFFRYMDSVGGFWIHRWGNNPVRTFAVTLLLEDKDVRTAFLPYAHQDFCSCGAGRACQWISEKEEYTCDEKSEPAAIAMEELAEGLLDLQPGITCIGLGDIEQLALVESCEIGDDFSGRCRLPDDLSLALANGPRDLNRSRCSVLLGAGAGGIGTQDGRPVSSGVYAGGWSDPQGAVGSDFKIDASYISPNVSIANSIEHATRKYGVRILISQTVAQCCTKEMASKMRLIDKVTIKGSLVPLELYCLDLDFKRLQVEDRPELPITWNSRYRFKSRHAMEMRKNHLWADEFSKAHILKKDPHFQEMRTPYTDPFLQKFNMGYQNYAQGEWQVARNLLIQTHTMLRDKDGPSEALLRFMEKPHQFKAPEAWRGVHALEDPW
ncbi:KTR3 [Symbiodinium sp. KB8]|nr:KTR3 [Symbiodinium sp. KB8]